MVFAILKLLQYYNVFINIYYNLGYNSINMIVEKV